MDKQERTKLINKKLLDFRGPRWMPWLHFDSEILPHVEYYYDENDDCLHADTVSEPFHYEIDEITGDLIDRCLEQLQVKVWEYYKERGIELRFYDD